jgi:transcriptional regulator GlxA family with amidase domain
MQQPEPKETSTINRVAILLFDGVELLDFAGPFEVFSAARSNPDSPDRLMEVFTVAEQDDPIICRNGLVVLPSYSLKYCPYADILVIPGGQGTRTAIHNKRLIAWIHQRAGEVSLTTSVCTGSFLLAQAGLLTGKAATTHWGSIQRLRDDFPDLDVRENQRWVDAGEIITSAGVSAGIDMALHVLDRIYGPDIAAATARGIEYDYWKS